MGKTYERDTARAKRKQRIRKKVSGTAERPRLTIFRSSRHMYAQVIDDGTGHTLVSASTLVEGVRDDEKALGNIDGAKRVGQAVAAAALGAGISKVVFDRNGYLYHGRVKALAEAAREAGLEF